MISSLSAIRAITLTGAIPSLILIIPFTKPARARLVKIPTSTGPAESAVPPASRFPGEEYRWGPPLIVRGFA